MTRARLLIFALFVAMLFALACSSPTASCEQANVMAGQWTYRATRESPVAGTIVAGGCFVTKLNERSA